MHLRLAVLPVPVLLAASTWVAAQTLNVPGLPAVAPTAASAPAAAASEPVLADWVTRLGAARVEHQQLMDQSDGSVPLLSQRQVASLRRVVLLAARVDALQARSAGTAADKLRGTTVEPLAGRAPYRLLDVDALRDQLDDLTVQRAALEGSLKSLDATIEIAVKERAAGAANVRLRQEQAASTRPGLDPVEARAQLQLAELLAEVAELEVLQNDETRRRIRERVGALAAPIAQLEQEIERARGRQRFDDADLRKVLDGIAAERRRSAAAGTRLAERLARHGSGLPNADSTGSRELEAFSDAMQSMRELEGVWQIQETLWRRRRDLLAPDADPQVRRAAAAEAAQGLREIQARQRRLADETRRTRADLRRQRALVAEFAAGDPLRAGEQRVLEALQTQADTREQLRDAFERTAVLVARTREDAGGTDAPAGTAAWFERAWDMAVRGLSTAWNFELFSATETTRIDGREVTVDYGVTVGKSVGAIVLFVVGYWGAGFLARRVIEAMRARLHLSDHLARVLRRWVNSLLVLVVLLLVLKMARVPITAFAFLGGALAIGFGFGAQNVIKNLISGIIILFERKIRVGDIVTVGGMVGTVVTVDLRATTVRGFDGIDAIVPNSTLLENQISNWSGGSPNVRRTVGVGVAYGSDVRRAAQVVLDCAVAHPSVLQSPAPEVLFSDFGNDSLALTLLYWTPLGGTRGGPAVDSDLRFAIADGLQRAGIAIPFPQRDVHLDVPAALRVELCGQATAAPPPGAAAT